MSLKPREIFSLFLVIVSGRNKARMIETNVMAAAKNIGTE